MSTPDTPAAFTTVTFIGLGLIGGSLAKLVRHQLPQTRIQALDTPAVLAQAQAAGVIDASLTDLGDSALYQSDLVVLGTHLHQSYDILKTLAETAETPICVMDLGSTKADICALAETLPETLRFIGGHPLAGREVSGFENSLWDLFRGKRFLLTPCSNTSTDFEERMVAWLTQLGTIPVVVNREDHDRLMSLVSHFPQFYAVALANLLKDNNPDEALTFLGGGIDDQMRLMASPFEMWGDVFHDNKAQLNAVLSRFIGILQSMQADLQADNLAPWFENSHAIYHQYQQKKTMDRC